MEPYLVERAARGDRNAFAELAAGLGDRLYSVAHRILRDRELAGDLTQHTLVKIWRDLPTLHDVSRFNAWSYRLVVNACYDELRRRRQERTHLSLVDTDAVEQDSQLTVADRDQLERGFRRLSAEHRAVVILAYYLEFQMPEIAESLGIPLGTVRSRLHYARRALRAALEADERAVAGKGRTA